MHLRRLLGKSPWVATLAVYVAAFLVLPTAIFSILGQYVFLQRALVNVDYLLLGSVAGLLPVPLLVVLFFLLFGLDLFIALALIYHFDPISFLLSARFITDLSLDPTAIAVWPLAAVAVFAMAAGGLVAASRKRWSPRWAFVLVLIACATLFADLLNGTNTIIPMKGTVVVSRNLATSSLFFLSRTSAVAINAGGTISGPKPIISAVSAALNEGGSAASDMPGAVTRAHLNAEVPPNIVLVIVESWGIFLNDARNRAVLAPLMTESLQERYEVGFASVPFLSSTTSAELRELCGVSYHYQAINADTGLDCLPGSLAARGFESVAFHGFTRHFFNRGSWYPLLGFDRMVFAEDMVGGGLKSRCGTLLRGVCDRDVARLVARELAVEEAPKFVYWLTLDSHLPVAPDAVKDSTLSCMPADADSFPAVCTLMRMWHAVMEEMAKIALASDTAPTLFILVGDHPPPLLTPREFALFRPREVPYVYLRPRSEELLGGIP